MATMRTQRIGTLVLVSLACLTLVVLGASVLLKLGAGELYALTDLARGRTPDQTRTVVSMWLGAQMSADIAPTDYPSLRTRADQLDQRAEWLREELAVVCLLGLVIGLLTGAPATLREPTSAADANTTSSGSA
jgi:hypothetical protein